MKKIHLFRAILSGAMVWSMVFSLFIILSIVPVIKDSNHYQGIIIALLIIPFALLGALFYYKKGATSNGSVVGLFMALTALVLDSCITVPFLILPTENGSYLMFYSDPLLWILIAENIVVLTLFWRLKKKVRI